MTPNQLQTILKCPAARASMWADPLRRAMNRFNVAGTLQKAAFIAQIGHESGRLRYVKELWGPTPAQETYERDFTVPWSLRVDGKRHRNSKPFELGNVNPGDGFRYRGRGLIQVTGRANYQKCGKALNVPLEDDPKLLEVPDIAALSAGWFWQANRCNELVGDFVALTKKINGGTNGLPDRLVLFAEAKRVLGLDAK